MSDTPVPAPLEPVKRTRLAILISGRGANCQAIARRIREGRLPGCEIAVVFSNIPDAPGVEAARQLGLPVITLEGRGREQRDHEDAISALLRKFRVDLVCLAGYRRIFSAHFVREWKGRLINMHASLLPAFPGRNPQQQALDYGAAFTGCTVFFVEEAVDGGVIILQRGIEIYDDDNITTLCEAILAEQAIAYSEAIRRIASGRYAVRGRRYVLREEPPALPAADLVTPAPEPAPQPGLNPQP